MPRHKRKVHGVQPNDPVNVLDDLVELEQAEAKEATRAYAHQVAQQSAPAPKPSLKAQIFQKVSDTFPDQAVAVVNYDLGHSKLQARGITVPHIGVRVQFTTPKGNFAVAGMLPETADDAAIAQLIGRLKSDALKHEEALTPRAAI